MQVNYSNSVEMSTVDWSGHISHTIFLNGCNMRCPYCYNGDVVKGEKFVPVQDLLDEITTASKYVDSVVFSGGEPMLQWNQVVRMIQHARDLGLKTAIHTNGMFPDKMRFLMKYADVDAWMVDMKANPLNPPVYMATTGLGYVPYSTINLLEGVFRNYDGEIEIRTTIVRGMNDAPADTRAIAALLTEWIGPDVKYVLQQGITDEAMDESLHDVIKLSRDEMLKLAANASEFLDNVYVRTISHGEELIGNQR